MIRRFQIWRLERSFLKLHRAKVHEFLRTEPRRLEQHLVYQMKLLIKEGVLPSWENFTRFGQSWDRMKVYFEESDRKRYEAEWKRLFKHTLQEDVQESH